MTRRERLMNTFAGRAVDRPAVSFYEIDGIRQDGHDPGEFNIFSDPSWLPLLQLAREKTDLMVLTGVSIRNNGRAVNAVPDEYIKTTTTVTAEGKREHTTLAAGNRVLTQTCFRERDIDTLWTPEHLIKNSDDLQSWIDLPEFTAHGEVDVAEVMRRDDLVGNRGVVVLDTPDPLCMVAAMMDMEEYTIVALTEPELFKQALDKAARYIFWKTEQVATALPGSLWRIFGPEYASPPYLPPRLFKEYAADYCATMVDIIHKHGGYARLHSHGNLKDILGYIAGTGCVGLDPIEPPPQGDVELSYVRGNYGKDMVLFGNLEACWIENMEPEKFRSKVRQAIDEGTAGEGRGFVLMPSSSPYGRKLPALAMKNYEIMIDEIEKI
ncbi:MAG: hypothetical protein L3J71_08040 [Victivallaceae bacterium]|nr:hypothetical protein [Victivallaceae bacterium]